jgi:hypothetical protein
MITAEEIAGIWLPDEDMHPLMNVYARQWMTKDGEMHGTCYGTIPEEARKRGIMWHFPIRKDNGPAA